MVTIDTSGWSAEARAAAGRLAFTPEQCPAKRACRWCGKTIEWGPGADVLDVTISLCIDCPLFEAHREALRLGVDSVLSGSAAPEEPAIRVSAWEVGRAIGEAVAALMRGETTRAVVT